MKLENLIQEMNLEVGNGKTFMLNDKLVSHKTLDKSGGMDETKQRLLDANEVLSKPSKQIIVKIVNYLRTKKMFDKISKLDLQSPDIVMRADGGAIVNFDDGGSLQIPASVIRNI